MRTYTLRGCSGNVSLLNLLQEEGAGIAADCGGAGICGKCTVYIDGERVKACEMFPTGDVTVNVPDVLEEIVAEGIGPGPDGNAAGSMAPNSDGCRADGTGLRANRADGEGLRANRASGAVAAANLAVCIDLGTTTIAGALLDTETGEIIASETTTNSQRAYGSDVVARVRACLEGRSDELKAAVRNDVASLTDKMLKSAGIEGLNGGRDGRIHAYVAGNTVMTHIFAGFDVSGLAAAPYRPVTTDFIETDGFMLMPGLSAFVGGDVLMGMIAAGAFDSDETAAFIDMGTNGEMAVGNRDGIYAAGTAAGPALEGGNISCGGPARPGAVYSVEIAGRLINVKTIGDVRADSICGSGIVDAVSEMLRNGIIDRRGNMGEEYDGNFTLCQNVTVTQDDIRQVQLAKSAIRAGLEILMETAGIEVSDVTKLYVAGGFGKNLAIDKCCNIGLIDPELKGRCVLAGNTSLLGTVKYAAGEITDEMIASVKSRTKAVNLADSESFQSRFIKYMDF